MNARAIGGRTAQPVLNRPVPFRRREDAFSSVPPVLVHAACGGVELAPLLVFDVCAVAVKSVPPTSGVARIRIIFRVIRIVSSPQVSMLRDWLETAEVHHASATQARVYSGRLACNPYPARLFGA
jgi:hypothetical protein